MIISPSKRSDKEMKPHEKDLDDLRMSADQVAQFVNPKDGQLLNAMTLGVFEQALRMIVRGDPDPGSIATIALRCMKNGDRTMRDVLMEDYDW